MTTVRKLALGISSWVTWLASPGSKEWAEGLECEVAFIDSDWRALRWAIGSTRVVLERREAPIRSLAQAGAIAKDYRDSYGNRMKFGLPLFLWICSAAFCWLSVTSRLPAPPMLRVGSCLIAAATLCDGYRALVYRRQKTDNPLDARESDAYEWAVYYRFELQKDLEFVGGRMAWTSGAVLDTGYYLILCSGLTFLPGRLGFLFAFIYLFIVASGVFPKYARYRKLQWKIADLDGLIATSSKVRNS